MAQQNTNRILAQLLASQTGANQSLGNAAGNPAPLYVEGTHRNAARASRTLIANKVDQAARGIVDMRNHGVPFSVMTGVQPTPYYGSGVDDVENFIESCERCTQANAYPVKRIVANLSYYLQGNAQAAFKAEVRARMEKRTDRKPLANGIVDEEEVANEIRLTQKQLIESRTGESEDLQQMETIGLKIQEHRDLVIRMEEQWNETQEEEQVMTRSTRRKLEVQDGEETEEASKLPVQISEEEMRSAKVLLTKELLKLARLEDERETKQLEREELEKRLGKLELQQIKTETKVEDTLGDECKEYQAFPDVEEFYNWLRKAFGREEITEALQSAFFGRKQRPDEDVRTFGYELQDLSQRARVDLNNKEMTKRFMKGLLPRIRERILHQIYKGTFVGDRHDFTDVIAAASEMERRIPSVSLSRRPNTRETWAGEDYDGDAAEGRTPRQTVAAIAGGDSKRMTSMTKGPMITVMEKVLTTLERLDSGQGSRVKVCNTCGRRGHEAKDCLQGAKAEMTCYACNEKGHMARDCPRAEAQRNNLICYTCGKPGHMARNCQLGRRGRAMDLSNIRCYACNQMGHYATACPTRGNNQGNGTALVQQTIQCQRCNQLGHPANKCPELTQGAEGQKQINC